MSIDERPCGSARPNRKRHYNNSLPRTCPDGAIEPLFAVAFMRRQAGMEMPDVNPEFVRIAKERGCYSEELMERVAKAGGVRDIEEIPEDVRRVFVTSQEISPEFHVR